MALTPFFNKHGIIETVPPDGKKKKRLLPTEIIVGASRYRAEDTCQTVGGLFTSATKLVIEKSVTLHCRLQHFGWSSIKNDFDENKILRQNCFRMYPTEN